ncbi:MAG: hypothetical protein AABY22_17000 [Nanoarchaeota archaeon]
MNKRKLIKGFLILHSITSVWIACYLMNLIGFFDNSLDFFSYWWHIPYGLTVASYVGISFIEAVNYNSESR